MRTRFRIEHIWHLVYRARPFAATCSRSGLRDRPGAVDIKARRSDCRSGSCSAADPRRVRLHVLVGGGTRTRSARRSTGRPERLHGGQVRPARARLRDCDRQLVSSPARWPPRREKRAGMRSTDLRVAPQARPHQGDRRLQRARAVSSAVHRGPDPARLDRDAGEIAKRIDAPIAMGERLSSIWEFEELLSRNVAILVRPTSAWPAPVGMSQDRGDRRGHHCGVSPHNFLGPAHRPTLHLCATIPNS